MIDSNQCPAAAIVGSTSNAGSSRPRGSRLEQGLRAKARAAIKRGDDVVHIYTSIRTTKSKPACESGEERAGSILLDPELVGLSRWANRHEHSYLSSAFLELKQSIQHDGGNQVPILVRPQPNADSSSPPYELVYGHRRLRACRELGLLVRAIVEEFPESRRLVERMHAENRDRESLSAFETGAFYKRLLSERMYASQRKLAEALGVDQGDVSRKVWLASLPADFFRLVGSPIEITCDDVKRLQPAWNRDPEGMRRHIKSLLDEGMDQTAKQMVSKLVAGPARKGDGASITRDQQLVEIRGSHSTGMTIKVNAPLSENDREQLQQQIEAFLSARGFCEAPATSHAERVL
ncbi:ParB/RepB/Spo0J family partition protein [Methylibium rhizosphaerae]|uniref:ParB/RepB/Spo0J family partition protein n=1 Tax=Methylibium rhizosphaerae TaxID=2570323 RepID=UPI00112AD623|nr:ParB/RepB/Spo0J family partition protein [Methylibium rhizosphaerae]